MTVATATNLNTFSSNNIGVTMPQKEREAVPTLTEMRQDGYQVIDTQRGDSNQIIRFATQNQNINLTNMDEVARNANQMRAFEVDRNGRAVRELSQNEMYSALGLPAPAAPFVQGQQQEALQNYRNDIQSALDAGDPVLAVQRGFTQWYYGGSLRPQMAGIFNEVLGFDIIEMRGSSRENIVALLEEKGMETRVARAPEVREEPRVAVAAPTEQQRVVDMAMFETSVRGFTQANGPQSIREGELATAVRFYDLITGYSPEEASKLESMFQKGTGLTIEQARERTREI